MDHPGGGDQQPGRQLLAGEKKQVLAGRSPPRRVPYSLRKPLLLTSGVKGRGMQIEKNTDIGCVNVGFVRKLKKSAWKMKSKPSKALMLVEVENTPPHALPFLSAS